MVDLEWDLPSLDVCERVRDIPNLETPPPPHRGTLCVMCVGCVCVGCVMCAWCVGCANVCVRVFLFRMCCWVVCIRAVSYVGDLVLRHSTFHSVYMWVWMYWGF